MKNKNTTSKSLLTESEKFRFQELAGIKPRSSKLIKESFPDDQDEVEEEPVTDPMAAEPHSSPEMEGGADVGVAEDPMVDKIVELVSRGIRTALLDAKQSGELDISTSAPEEVEGADLEPSTEPALDSDLGPETDETENHLGTPDEEKLQEVAPLPSPRQDKHDFYKKLEEDLFESMKKAAKRAIQESSKTSKKVQSKPISTKKK